MFLAWGQKHFLFPSCNICFRNDNNSDGCTFIALQQLHQVHDYWVPCFYFRIGKGTFSIAESPPLTPKLFKTPFILKNLPSYQSLPRERHTNMNFSSDFSITLDNSNLPTTGTQSHFWFCPLSRTLNEPNFQNKTNFRFSWRFAKSGFHAL